MSLAAMPGHQLLDGEVCVVDERGRGDFERLKRGAQMRRYKPGADLVAYRAFDILVNGRGRWASSWCAAGSGLPKSSRSAWPRPVAGPERG